MRIVTLKFECDSCHKEFVGHSYGYEGDLCAKCHFENKIRELSSERFEFIKRHENRLAQLDKEIETVSHQYEEAMK